MYCELQNRFRYNLLLRTVNHRTDVGSPYSCAPTNLAHRETLLNLAHRHTPPTYLCVCSRQTCVRSRHQTSTMTPPTTIPSRSRTSGQTLCTGTAPTDPSPATSFDPRALLAPPAVFALFNTAIWVRATTFEPSLLGAFHALHGPSCAMTMTRLRERTLLTHACS